jgi:hypothetical protein
MLILMRNINIGAMMEMIHRYVILMLVIFTFVMIGSCVSKVYPDKRLAIAPDFLALFSSVTQKDTFSFRNASGNRKVFVITNIDSIIRNGKGWFINERPYKLLRMNFREIGDDTTRLERENEIFVNKYPDNNISSLYIKFNNFYYHRDTVLPGINHNMAGLNNEKITDYYLFETLLGLKGPNDIKTLYINGAKGFLGFKTQSGEIWMNEKE